MLLSSLAPVITSVSRKQLHRSSHISFSTLYCVWYRKKYILTGLKSKHTRCVHTLRQTLHNSTKVLGDLEHSIACEQPWFQRRIIGTCSTKRLTYSNHITLPREPLNWGQRTLSLDLTAAQTFATI
jgi:hypothetical protein